MNKLEAVSNKTVAAGSPPASDTAPVVIAGEDGALSYQSGAVSLRTWRGADGGPFFDAARANGASTGPRPAQTKIYLAGMEIDPAVPAPPGVVPDALLAKADASLQIVQFVSQS